MGIRAKDIVELRRTFEVDAAPIGFPGDHVTLTYRPNYFDVDAEARQKTYLDDPRVVEPLYGLFVDAVISWDIEPLPGKKFPEPLTVESLRENQISGRVVGYLWRAVLRDYNLGEASTAGGSTGSPPTDSSESRPTTSPGTA